MKKIDYRQYKDDELLDIERHIDKHAFAERYQQLRAEIERRQALGSFNKKSKSSDWDEDDEEEYRSTREIIIEFSPDKPIIWRVGFVTLFVLINIVVLAWQLPNYVVKSLSDLHQYTHAIDGVKCHTEVYVDSETDQETYSYHIIMQMYPSEFIAPNLHQSKCKEIERNLTINDAVSLWHNDFIIHQLNVNNQTVLSYNYMKAKVRNFQTQDGYIFLIGLVALWLSLGKSLVNAFKPGTFSKNGHASKKPFKSKWDRKRV